MKRLLHACQFIYNYFGMCSRRFRVNSHGSEIGRFWAKSLGYSLGFWKWPIWLSAGNRSKSLKRLLCASKWISNYLQARSRRFRVNSHGSEIGRFWAKSVGYSPWFWRWRILVSVGNRSKLPETRILHACNGIFNYFGVCSRWYLVNSQRVRHRPTLSRKPGP